jgi:hypothetical protein
VPYLAGIRRPQDLIAGLARHLSARRRRVPGRVKLENGPRRDADSIPWNRAQKHGASGRARPINLHPLSGPTQRAESRQVIADLSAGIVMDSDGGGCCRDTGYEKHSRDCCARYHRWFVSVSVPFSTTTRVSGFAAKSYSIRARAETFLKVARDQAAAALSRKPASLVGRSTRSTDRGIAWPPADRTTLARRAIHWPARTC